MLYGEVHALTVPHHGACIPPSTRHPGIERAVKDPRMIMYPDSVSGWSTPSFDALSGMAKPLCLRAASVTVIQAPMRVLKAGTCHTTEHTKRPIHPRTNNGTWR